MGYIKSNLYYPVITAVILITTMVITNLTFINPVVLTDLITDYNYANQKQDTLTITIWVIKNLTFIIL